MTAMRRKAGAALGGMRLFSSRTLGVLTVVVVLLAVPTVFSQDRIRVFFTSGETVTAELSRSWPVEAYSSEVKMAGVVVGIVTGIQPTDRGTAVVTMDVSDDAAEKLGTTPSATVRPTLVLGGKFYVDLVPGGNGEFSGARIPVERTTLPVELGDVLHSFSPDALQGMQTAIGQTEATLQQGGQDAVKRLLQEAPATLEPAGVVLDAARGTNPETDLTEMVRGLQSTATVLNEKDGQLASIFDSLAGTTGALAAGADPLAEAAEDGAESLRVTRAGMIDLRATLDQLTTTAASFRGSAQALDPLLADLDPVLQRARPLLADLQPLLADTRPLVERLVPTAQQSTTALADFRGPVLDRINGPIADAVLSPWKGTGVYEGGGQTGHRTYEETGYLLAKSSRIYQFYDRNGGIARLAVGTGINGLLGGGGTPESTEQYLEELGLDKPGPDADREQDQGQVLPNAEESGAPGE